MDNDGQWVIEWVSMNGVSQNGGFIREYPNIKGMITGGTPISGNLHILK